MMAMVNHHEDVYSKTLALLRNPPEDVMVIELAPIQPLSSRILGSSVRSLEDDYELGWKTAEVFLQNFSHWPIYNVSDKQHTVRLSDPMVTL